MFTYSKLLPDPQATDKLAGDLAPYLMPGDVIALTGYLGAGKSHFARALVRALGSRQKHLPSPTFTLLQTYDDTRMPVAHTDFYRLGDPSEAEELNLDPFIEHGLTVIEWADNAPHMCPARTLWVRLEDEGGGRSITFKSEDDSWEKRFGFFTPDLQRPVTDKGRHDFVQRTTGKKGQVITPVSADASFRSYWRVRMGDSAQILMDAPAPMEDLERFVRVDKFLEANGVRVPHVYEADLESGYALIEDFGNSTVFDAVESGADPMKHYEAAVDILAHIAQSEKAAVPRQEKENWLDEACHFTDWFLPYATGHATHTADRRQFRELIWGLMAQMPELPQTTMLKDYHCQNLMVLPDGAGVESLGVLDFQDARIGPVSYDLASLLYDVRYKVPSHFHSILTARMAGSMPGHVTPEALSQGVKMVAIQNLLRIAGVFTRLARRDGKTQYLDYMPLLWSHADALLAEVPEAEALAAFIDKQTPSQKEVAV